MMDPNLISTMEASRESVVDKLGEDLVLDMFGESRGETVQLPSLLTTTGTNVPCLVDVGDSFYRRSMSTS